MKLDPGKMSDWEISEAASENAKTVHELAESLGVEPEEVIPYGPMYGKLDYRTILDRAGSSNRGKYIDVTAITPTPLGEGKTTTTIGLVEGLGALGKKVTGAIRQPSGGPTFNIKGSGAGGGLAQCIPLTDLSLGLTGDIDAVTNAHNLAMVAVTSRLQHEFNYSDKQLERRALKRLDIDPRNPAIGWAIDLCAQALRDIVIGIGGTSDGFMMKSGFQITVSSEIMAILAVASDLADFRSRIAKMTVAYDRRGNSISAADLEVDGAMTAIMARAINPNLMQTAEGQPVFVHAGPFANISIGQSSIVADRLGLALSDYHVTESGFGADIGFEKFWNLKCRMSGLTPDAAVIVCTIRALKLHGGGPDAQPGKKLDRVYREKNVELVERGVENLLAHIETVKKSGITPVVCLNHFVTDDDDEIRVVREAASAGGARMAVGRHWQSGGEGARELAEAVIDAAEENTKFSYLYSSDSSIKQRIETIAREVYGASGVEYSAPAEQRIQAVSADPTTNAYGVCIVKTHLSLSADPTAKGRPVGWTLPVRDVFVYNGAELIVPVAGEIKLMPGTGSDPSYRRIDVDVKTGRVTGLS